MRAGGHRPAIATNIHRTVRHGGTAAPARPATLEHFNKCGFRKALPHGGDPRTHELPRQGILDKYDHAVMTPEAAPVGHQRIHAQFEELAGNKGIYKWFGHASSEAPA